MPRYQKQVDGMGEDPFREDRDVFDRLLEDDTEQTALRKKELQASRKASERMFKAGAESMLMGSGPRLAEPDVAHNRAISQGESEMRNLKKAVSTYVSRRKPRPPSCVPPEAAASPKAEESP